MTESIQDELEIRRALEVAENHLDEAENVVWIAANTVDREPLETEIDDITQRIWALQHTLQDVKHELAQ